MPLLRGGDMSTHVAVRLEANFRVGMGHLVRCQALLKLLLENDFIIYIFTSEKSDEIRNYVGTAISVINMPFFKSENDDANWIKKYIEINNIKFKYMLVDHYGLSAIWEEIIRSIIKDVIAIDDLANRHHKSTYLIDSGFGRNKSDYKILCDDDTIFLLGEEYCLLREEFLIGRDKAMEIRSYTSSIRSILVSFGGTDPKNHTLKVVDYLSKLKKDYEIHILTTSLNENIENLMSFSESNDGIYMHCDVKDIVSLLLKVDFAVGALGGASIERIFLGIPSLCVTTENNQTHNAGALSSLNVITLSNENNIFNDLRKCLSDGFMNKWHEMSRSCFKLYDGMGINRVAYSVFGIKPKINLLLMSKSHCFQLFKWQCENGNRKYSRNESVPSLVEHQKWYEDSLKSADRTMWIIEFNNIYCGYIRVDSIDDYLEISILMSKKLRRLGLAGAAIESIKSKFNSINILASVHPDNKPSINLFLKAGFVKLTKDTYIWTAE